MIGKLARHLRRGTLGEMVDARLGRLSAAERVRWYGTRSVAEAAESLAQRAQHAVHNRPAGRVLLVGGDSVLRRLLTMRLTRRGIAFRECEAGALAAMDAAAAQGLAIILCTDTQVRAITEGGRAAAGNAALAAVPYEYVSGLESERAFFARHDEYRDTFFVAPQLLEDFSIYGLYEESLRHFEQKCGLRDYLDLAQCIRHVVAQNVAGDIAEFGSFRGHSGWLMARLLQGYGSDKHLHLFDAFERFPQEALGIDHFWSETHDVDFAEVKSKFAELPQVRLVRGDFTQTLATSGIRQLALAYIDCDSLRATRYLIDHVLDSLLAPQGLLVIEDYGHPALLGSRVAVHEALDTRPGLFRFFSQFSGLYVVARQG